VLDLLHFDHLAFLQYLDGIEALVVLRLDEMHSPKAARAQGTLNVEVTEGVFPLRRAHRGDDGTSVGGLVGVIARV